jgi:glycosyltransferase involved in cell wall biosynthesis
MVFIDPRPDFERHPFITIAIPTFNRASWLHDCVASGLSQTYRNFEIVVSDNASTDDTQEVLKQLSDPRLRVIRQQNNVGFIPNWNACLTHARGEYIIFVSDDDRIAPYMLERCVDLIAEDPTISVVMAICDTHLASRHRTRPGQISTRLRTGIRNGTDILAEYLRDHIDIAMTSIMLRTDALRAAGGFITTLPHACDVAAWAPLLLLGKAGFINEACATYTVHNETQSLTLGIDQVLRDGWHVANLISEKAYQLVVEPAKCQVIKRHARRCFARRGALVLLRFRAAGGRWKDMLQVAWRFRRELSYIGISIFGIAKPIAACFLPNSIISLIRRIKRLGQETCKANATMP